LRSLRASTVDTNVAPYRFCPLGAERLQPRQSQWSRSAEAVSRAVGTNEGETQRSEVEAASCGTTLTSGYNEEPSGRAV